jgi:arylsulfatase A-like enzyme
MILNPALKYQTRRLFLSVPTRQRQVIVKKMTIYDIAPTVLDLLGIDYKPKFVLGRSVFEKKASHILSLDEHEEIYSFFAQMKWEKRFKRRGRRRLFRGLYKLKKEQEGLPDIQEGLEEQLY